MFNPKSPCKFAVLVRRYHNLRGNVITSRRRVVVAMMENKIAIIYSSIPPIRRYLKPRAKRLARKIIAKLAKGAEWKAPKQRQQE